MKHIIFNYQNNTYHVIEEGKLPKIVPMTPRAAAHVAVILASRGWQVEHFGLIPHPQLDQSAISNDLAAINPPPAPSPVKPVAAPKASTKDKRAAWHKGKSEVKFPPNTITVAQAAQRLSCTVPRVHQLIAKGQLQSTRVYRGAIPLHAIPVGEIDAYLDNRERKNKRDRTIPDVVYPTAEEIKTRSGQTDSVNVPEAADLLSVSEASIYKLIYAGKLPAHKGPSGKQGPDRHWIKMADLLSFADQYAEQN